MRLGWSPDFGHAIVEPEVSDATEHAALAFQEMGCIVEQVNLDLENSQHIFEPIFHANISATYHHLLSQEEDLTDYAVGLIKQGAAISGAEYSEALGHVDIMRAKFDDAFAQYDLLLSPTMAVTAFPVGDPPSEIAGQEIDSSWGYSQFPAIINLIGYTAASIPCGFSSTGLPIGLHIIGRHGDEASVISASAAFEEAKPWATKRPRIS